VSVSGVSPSSRGCAARSVTVTAVRKAWASMARVVHRYQDLQVRTWCWSKPHSPFPAWNDSSIVQRRPATLTSTGKGHLPRRVAAVEGQFTSAAVPADQQPPAPGLSLVDVDQRPGVEPLAFRAGPGRGALPGPLGQGGGDLVDATGTDAEGDPVAGGDRQDVSGTPGLQLTA
jgi:hypothetical protein